MGVCAGCEAEADAPEQVLVLPMLDFSNFGTPGAIEGSGRCELLPEGFAEPSALFDGPGFDLLSAA